MFTKRFLFAVFYFVGVQNGSCYPSTEIPKFDDVTQAFQNTPPLVFPSDNSSSNIIKTEITITQLQGITLPPLDGSEESHVTPPIQFPSDSNTYNIIQNETILAQLANASKSTNGVLTPPTIFPSQSDERYTFSDNATAIQILNDESEVKDLREGGDFARVHEENKESKNDVSEMKSNKGDDKFNDETELIEDDGAEDNRIVIQNEVPVIIEREENGGAIQGQTAIILASVFIVFAVMGYALLMTWRRWLEKRYGNRELLVEEDDDLKHFSI